MLRVGITGGIAMGKSTSAAWLVQQGHRVVDTDEIARAVVAPGEVAFEEIVAAFGKQVVSAQGDLDRKALAAIVFQDPNQRKVLESITHPRIRDRWQGAMESWGREGLEMGFVVIPLLYETGADRELDSVVCVACSEASQRSRMRHRGWSDDEASQRVKAQMSVDEKMKKARFVVWTEGERELQAGQWRRILACFVPVKERR